ncbi:hypothetical protein [Porphyromonas gingivalis]|uniref:hypothetical protein n=1 Tax=Porphyromonas gingivalis TaxID=837 RepID=UPI001F23C856|nr:hypothetical protein [Porphyromonas gingivalis]
MVYSGRKNMCSFFHGKEKIIECFYGFIDTDYIASDFISLRKDSPQKSYRSEQCMKPPVKNGKEGKSLDWPRDLAEKVPVSPYFCPVLNEKSHK